MLVSLVLKVDGEAVSERISGELAVELKESVTPENCRRVEFSLPSKAMGRDIRVAMILPPAFQDNGSETYPVLYMLHGMNAPYDTWTQMSPLRELLKDHPMILVAFDGDPSGWYLDAPKKKESQFKTFFFDELSPFVEQAFRGNGQRAVTGFSMGGFGAIHYMLCQPDYFTSVSSLSGSLRSLADYNQRLLRRMKPLLGGYQEGASAYDILDVTGRMSERLQTGTIPPPLFLACGASDSLLDANRGFRDILMEKNKKIIDQLTAEVADIENAKIRRKTLRNRIAENQINYIYEEAPGGHDFLYWNTASERVGLFHWKWFQVSAQ